MKLLLVQLGDVHMTRNSPAMSARFQRLPNALRDLDAEVSAIVIALTGDVTWSGKEDQFQAFNTDFEPLLQTLAELFPKVRAHVVGVPGNHDCDFTDPMAGARQHILHSLARSSSDIDEATVNLCCSVQKNFFAFLARKEAPSPFNRFGCAAYDYQIPIDDQHIVIRCFNTALTSTNPENPGQLVYPLRLLNEPKTDTPTAYWIALFHHPYSWLSPAIKRSFMERVENSCDLILTGHEHATAYYKKETYSGLESNYIEGGALSGGGDESAGLNAIVVDIQTCTERAFSLTWSDDHYAVTDVSNGWRPYRRSRAHREFELSEKMLDYLQDPGAQFIHPGKPRLLLEDIFVPPNLQELRLDEPDDVLTRGETTIESKNAVAYIANAKRALVMGNERTGKTTLAKVLFRYLYSKGQLPVLINGAEIKKPDIDRFRTIVETSVSHDYRNASVDKFNQLDDASVTLLIDDFDHARLNTKGKLKLLQAIGARYSNVIVFADDVMWLTELVSGEVTANLLTEFTQIKIAEFGYLLRSALIDRWYDVNIEYVVNPEQLTAKVQTVERYIDDFLGRSYLPSVPIFVLMLLQSFDASQPMESSVASYGYLYSVLITRQLALGQRTLSLDKKLAYLVELAFYMYTRQKTELTSNAFDKFHREHCARYVWINPDLIKSELEKAGILELYHDMYRFKYNYFYYYFVAEYFNRHIEDEHAKEQVQSLCEHLEDDDNANIILFLTHQSRSTFVLETIVGRSAKIFADISPPEFGADVDFLIGLYETVPKLVYVDKTTEEMRQERRAALDREAAKPDEKPTKISGDTDAVLRTVQQIRAAVRSLEVMGQIVKNYAGSMTNEPKYTLVKECYDVGLRVVGVILQAWQQTGAEFVQEVLDAILAKRKDVESKAVLERLLKQFLFLHCEMIAFYIIKRISHAVGAKDLEEIYERVLEENSANSYRLIDYSIKVDRAGFPTTETASLADRVGDNVFCSRLLAHLAMHHFYLFHTSEQTKQQVCAKLGIRMETLRRAELTGADRKRLPGS